MRSKAPHRNSHRIHKNVDYVILFFREKNSLLPDSAYIAFTSRQFSTGLFRNEDVFYDEFRAELHRGSKRAMEGESSSGMQCNCLHSPGA
jgi:hypothetical protein